MRIGKRAIIYSVLAILVVLAGLLLIARPVYDGYDLICQQNYEDCIKSTSEVCQTNYDRCSAESKVDKTKGEKGTDDGTDGK